MIVGEAVPLALRVGEEPGVDQRNRTEGGQCFERLALGGAEGHAAVAVRDGQPEPAVGEITGRRRSFRCRRDVPASA